MFPYNNNNVNLFGLILCRGPVDKRTAKKVNLKCLILKYIDLKTKFWLKTYKQELCSNYSLSGLEHYVFFVLLDQ